jgi:multidrug efflux system membrane fusion protein
MMKIASGTLLTADNQIDQSTGTSRLKAVFDNADNALFPNQFVNVHLLLDVVKDATVITAAAVQRGPQGTYVYVVDADKKAHIRVVTLKTTQGNDVSVGPELKPGELVVVEGTDKVQDGARVDLQTPGAPAGQNGGSGRGGSGGSGGGEGRGGRGKRSGQ